MSYLTEARDRLREFMNHTGLDNNKGLNEILYLLNEHEKETPIMEVTKQYSKQLVQMANDQNLEVVCIFKEWHIDNYTMIYRYK